MQSVLVKYRFKPLVSVEGRARVDAVKKAYRLLYGSKWRGGRARGLLDPGSYERLGKGSIRIRDPRLAAKAIVALLSMGFEVEAKLEGKPLLARAVEDPNLVDECFRESARFLEKAVSVLTKAVAEAKRNSVDEALSLAVEALEALVESELVLRGEFKAPSTPRDPLDEAFLDLIALIQERFLKNCMADAKHLAGILDLLVDFYSSPLRTAKEQAALTPVATISGSSP